MRGTVSPLPDSVRALAAPRRARRASPSRITSRSTGCSPPRFRAAGRVARPSAAATGAKPSARGERCGGARKQLRATCVRPRARGERPPPALRRALRPPSLSPLPDRPVWRRLRANRGRARRLEAAEKSKPRAAPKRTKEWCPLVRAARKGERASGRRPRSGPSGGGAFEARFGTRGAAGGREKPRKGDVMNLPSLTPRAPPSRRRG